MTEEGRHSIWSVSAENQRLFSILFPSLWLVGMVFHVGWEIPWTTGAPGAIVRLTESIATTGVASAVLSMMILAAKEGIMVLFDWAAERRRKREQREEKELQEARQEGVVIGRQEERREWQAWAQRLLEAKERGEDFDEPPPSAKNGADPK